MTDLGFDGLVNARDVGGLLVANGDRIRCGMLYRSETPQLMTDQDVGRAVDELGIRRVVDLRGARWGSSGAVGESGRGVGIDFFTLAGPPADADGSTREGFLPGLLDRAGLVVGLVLEETLEDKVPGVGLRWETEWKPAIIAKNTTERKADYSSLDDEALLAKLADMKRHMTFMWHVHGHINFVLISSSKFADLYDEIVQPDDPTEAYQCLQGWETQSLASSRGLWRLSRLARAEPELVAMFESTSPADLVDALEATGAGRGFMAELRAYLEDFGWRSDAVYDLGDVTWREDPSIPLGALVSYVPMGDSADPELLFEKALANRDRLLAAAQAKLADDPERMAEFDELHEAARYSNPLTEDHAFWIDQMGIAVFRRFVLHIGRRLADRGLLGDASDVNFLTEEELIDAARNGTDRRAVAGRRREEHAAWATIEPPPALGTPPEPAEDPFMDALTVRLLGITPPDDSPEDPDAVNGVSGSAGMVTGTVKVVRSLVEASLLDDGDIMVCEMTLPPWVPLFSIVGGVVTDTGGVLSHCAIVAREFELPAVVGTQVGTTVLENGMTVTIDGAKGTVTIDSRP